MLKIRNIVDPNRPQSESLVKIKNEIIAGNISVNDAVEMYRIAYGVDCSDRVNNKNMNAIITNNRYTRQSILDRNLKTMYVQVEAKHQDLVIQKLSQIFGNAHHETSVINSSVSPIDGLSIQDCDMSGVAAFINATPSSWTPALFLDLLHPTKPYAYTNAYTGHISHSTAETIIISNPPMGLSMWLSEVIRPHSVDIQTMLKRIPFIISVEPDKFSIKQLDESRIPASSQSLDDVIELSYVPLANIPYQSLDDPILYQTIKDYISDFSSSI